MSKINALVLHWMGDPRFYREAVRSLEYMLPETRPDVNCIVHDTDIPFPEYLKEVDYDLIILGPTFLCNRYYPVCLQRVIKEYDFIKYSSACKVALPQDDYDCSAILDNWMTDWGVDCMYAVIPDHWDLLYPKFSKNKLIKLGYTGYISEKWIDSWKNPKPFSQRKIDVSYRASKLPANFGSIGQLKWRIAENFLQGIGTNQEGYQLDISVNPKDMIPGDAWHSFLENSKFCLITPSGSSLFDEFGTIRNCVQVYTSKFPNASFDEIENHCFQGQDRKYELTAISPRNLEAALSKTVQLATPGSYSGLMTPFDHYIPLEENCSNIKDVLDNMRDETLVTRIQENCRETMLSEKRLRIRTIADEIIELTKDVVSLRKSIGSDQHSIDRKFKKYHLETEQRSKEFWKSKRFKNKVKSVVFSLSGNYLKRMIS